jgi:hypothetical protein
VWEEITALTASQNAFEIDPNKLRAETDVSENFRNVERLTLKFIDAIVDSYEKVPK